VCEDGCCASGTLSGKDLTELSCTETGMRLLSVWIQVIRFSNQHNYVFRNKNYLASPNARNGPDHLPVNCFVSFIFSSSSIGDRVFIVAAASVWNSFLEKSDLPHHYLFSDVD